MAFSSSSPPGLLSFLISVLSLITLSLSSRDSSTPIKLSLSPLFPISSNTNPWQRLNHLTSSSLARVQTLKRPSHNSTNIPLFPQSYGGYSISLSFGSPPQSLSFVMDTGSSLVWFPCTHSYQCIECDFGDVGQENNTAFFPESSSSAAFVGCKNKKCGWVFGSDKPLQCTNNHTCPHYLMQYGSGATTGVLLLETLNFPERKLLDFLVGCSVSTIGVPSGIAGFGRGLDSLPVQMGVKKFSHCLVSHQFDGAPVSSDLLLVTESDSGRKSGRSGDVISYTPLLKNPLTSNTAFQQYYYLSLRKITVGGKPVKVPYSFLVPGKDGNGGTIIDSGTTFTYIDNEVYKLVTREFVKQMSQFNRSMDAEDASGLGPCFAILGNETASFPKLVFHFKGGAEMTLPLADLFTIFEYDTSVACLTLVSNYRNASSEAMFGPSIVIGNYQQQNFYMEYDLENERFGFTEQTCK